MGVTVIWLSPVYKSPMFDMGYDISNFTDIDPIFGTMSDFDSFVKKVKELGKLNKRRKWLRSMWKRKNYDNYYEMKYNTHDTVFYRI